LQSKVQLLQQPLVVCPVSTRLSKQGHQTAPVYAIDSGTGRMRALAMTPSFPVASRRITGEKMQRRLNCFLLAIVAATPAFGGPVINLGSASAFGLLGGTAISNTGTSVITGDVGVQNASATITGFYPTGATTSGPAGVIAPGNSLSNNAYTDFVNAFNTAQLLTPTQFYSDLSLSRTFTGNTVYGLPAGVSSTSGISLTFDAQNDPSAIFVVQTPGAFTANGALTFILSNQAQADRIFWIVGTNATLSPGSSGPMTFDGNILAGQAFTMSAQSGGSGVLAGTINGCVFAETANTLAGQTVVNGCASLAGSAPSSSGVPEPMTSGLAGLGCLVGAWRVQRRKRSRQ
jgi:hypothetical protein